MSAPAPAPGATSETGSLVGVVKWLIASAGLSGIFVASGYIVETAYQKFLGVEFPDLSSSDYILAAGGFLLDSLSSVYTLAASHIVTLAVILALLAGGAAFAWRRFGGRPLHIPAWAILVAALALGAGKMAVLDVPTAYANEMLSRVPSDVPSASLLAGLAKRRAQATQRLIVCAHNEDWVEDPRDSPPAAALKKSCGAGPLEPFQQVLSALYLWNLGLTVATLTLGMLWIRMRLQATLRAAVVSLLLLFSVIGLCESYAHTIRGTAFRQVALWREGGAERANPDFRGLLLRQGSQVLILYDEPTATVQQIPREKIGRIQVEAKLSDVIAEHIKATNRRAQN